MSKRTIFHPYRCSYLFEITQCFYLEIPHTLTTRQHKVVRWSLSFWLLSVCVIILLVPKTYVPENKETLQKWIMHCSCYLLAENILWIFCKFQYPECQENVSWPRQLYVVPRSVLINIQKVSRSERWQILFQRAARGQKTLRQHKSIHIRQWKNIQPGGVGLCTVIYRH